MSTDLKKFSNGEVYFWIENGTSIHLKAASENDPVELSLDEAKAIGEELIQLAEELEAGDKGCVL